MGFPRKGLDLLIFLLCSFCFEALVLSSFTPVDNLLITCGESKAIKDEYGRTFQPDSGNSRTSFSGKSHNVVSIKQNGLSDLYSSARVFNSEGKYLIGTEKSGRHWLRLHFHPFHNGQNHTLKSANFSVVANGVKLLHAFSFSRSTHSVPVVKEYVIGITASSSSNGLELKFLPLSGSNAFINGIEVLSVPDGLFSYSVSPIPMASTFEIPENVAFQTMFRLNMGGPNLTPRNDTLWRSWKSDHAFLLNPASARPVSEDPRLVKYPEGGGSVEIAPNWVYATAQEMSDANVIDPMFNISWSFDVDKGFDYFIRMHFCDIVSKVRGSLIFNVYINNHTAVASFDISSKTMALSTAYFIDFVVNGSKEMNKILVQIGPPSQQNFPPNAILNGLEIQKMSDSSNRLDGSFGKNDATLKPPRGKKFIVLMASIGGSAVLLLIFATLLMICFRQPKKKRKKRKLRSLSWLPVPTNLGYSETKMSANSFASTAASMSFGRVLSFSEVSEATKDFDESLVIGVGGFGKVYRGMLESGAMVAVKRGNPKSQQGLLEFRTEIEMLSKLRHRHLVSLIGYCEELNEMILVYDFMSGGPLRRHLYGSNLAPLSWKKRLEICIGAAKGLHYLHTGAAECIIHRDVKTTNILLDENFTAKVADFGLSKSGPALDQTHVSTAVKGSFGYLDPEYYRRQQLTEKSDVYSFGVVLLEVLCARPAINPALPREQVNIAEWAMFWQKRGKLEEIIDRKLVGSISIDSIKKFGETAEKCLSEYGIDRPTMGDVLWNLEYALQLQELHAQSVVDIDNSANHIPELPDCISHVEAESTDETETISIQELDTRTSTAVFSQLMNPKGREREFLTQQIENLDGKMDEQVEISKLIRNEVTDARGDISQIGYDLDELQRMVSGLDGKLLSLEGKHDLVNAGVMYLCNIVNGKRVKMPDNLQDQLTFVNSSAPSLMGLKDIADVANSLLITNGTSEDLEDKPIKPPPRTLSRTASNKC